MKKSLLRLSIVAFAALCLVMLAAPRPASAHPMGNFSVNKYSALTVETDRVDLLYVIDLAEIPAFQELGEIREDRSTDVTPEERDAYIARKAPELMKNLSLAVDGRPLQLALTDSKLSFPPGNGGLPTFRLELYMTAPLSGIERGTLQYKDGNYPDRVGWEEIIAVPGQGIAFQSSSVPSVDISKVLTEYNTNATDNAPRITEAKVTFALGVPGSAGENAPQAQPAQSDLWSTVNGWVQTQTNSITSILNQDELTFGTIMVAMLAAFGVGAAHALSPGHGKTVVAAYLIGSRGTPKHAIFLGLTVTISHTVGAYLAWAVIKYASDYIVPEALYSWLGFISGVVIAGMGVALFVQRWRALRRASVPVPHVHAHDDHTHDHDHPHEHDGHVHSHHEHDHDHEHSHDHAHDHTHDHEDDPSKPHKHGLFGREHTHLPPEGTKVTFGNLLALGIAGGIIPCPSAVLVLLVAVGSKHIDLGLPLLLAFSLGLAGVLTLIGLALVYGRSLAGRVRVGGAISRTVLLRLPVVSALAVCCLGILMAFGAINSR